MGNFVNKTIFSTSSRFAILALIFGTMQSASGADDTTYWNRHAQLLRAFANDVKSMKFSCSLTVDRFIKRAEGPTLKKATHLCHVWMDEKRARFEEVSESVSHDDKREVEKSLYFYDGNKSWSFDMVNNVAFTGRESDERGKSWYPPLLIFLGSFEQLRRQDNQLPFSSNPPLPTPWRRDSLWGKIDPLASPRGTVTASASSCLTIALSVFGGEYQDRLEISHGINDPLELIGAKITRHKSDGKGGYLDKTTMTTTVQVHSLMELKLASGMFKVPNKVTISILNCAMVWQLDKIELNQEFDDDLFTIDPSSAIAIFDRDSGRFIVDHR